MGARPWFDEAFLGDYLAVYPHRDVAAARAEVSGLAARELGALRGRAGAAGRVLDLGCGFGRHLLALREQGFAAFGLDRSLELLRLADGALRGRTARGDFRALPFRSKSFGALLMLFSSFGYFEDAENERVLAEVARVLAPGGLAVLDLMNPARVRATLVPESSTRRGGLEIHERRALVGKRVVKDVELRPADGRGRGWREDVRLYEPAELDGLLARAGLGHLRSEGDFGGAPLDAESPRQLVWARLERA